MFKWLSHRLETEKQKSKPVVSFVNELGRRRKASPSASVRSVLKTAVADAEQIVASIKMKAQTEAEEEAARIITQANREAEEIKRQAEAVTKKETEDILSAANRKAEEPREEVTEEKIEAPVQSREEVAVSEPVAVTTEELLEPHLPEGRPAREETEPGLPKQDNHPLYTGEVELDIASPVNPKVVSKLYNYLQMTPEIKLVRTSGSWVRGTTITVVLDKPIPLISVISSKIPEAEVIPERPEKDGFVKGKKGVRRIKLVQKKSSTSSRG